jgi:hypothetical protein
MAATRQRPFAFIDWLGESDGSGAASLRLLRVILLVHAGIRVWDRALLEEQQAFFAAEAVVLMLAAAAATRSRFGLLACPAAFWVLSVEVLITDGVANHVFLEWGAVGLFAFLDPDDDAEGELLLCTLRWMTLIVLFYTGLQKVLLGAYFRGELLAWMIAQRPPFEEFFGWMLPTSELVRLGELDGESIGSGPYRAASWQLLVLSNAVWLSELALPFLMAWRPTRIFAALGAAGFVIGLQLGAREVMFALLFSQLCLLMLPRDGYRYAAPLFGFAYLYLAGVLLGLLPGGFLLKESGL